MELFSKDWAEGFVHEWNASSVASKLRGLGSVTFRVTDAGESLVTLHWSERGQAKLLDEVDCTAPMLSASMADWLAFVRGEFSATAGVMDGRMRFEGQLTAILPYTLAFNDVAKVAGRVRLTSRP